MPYVFSNGLDPRKLPRGRFVINRGHRLGRGLIYAVFPGSIYGLQDLTAYVGPATVGSNYQLSGTVEGPANQAVANGSGAVVVGPVTNLTSIISATGGSIIWRGVVYGPALNNGSPGGSGFDIPVCALFSYTGGYSANWAAMHNDGVGNGGMVFATNVASTQTYLGPYALPSAGQMHSYGGTITLVSSMSAYLDGAFQGSTSLVSSPTAMPNPAIFLGAYTTNNPPLTSNTASLKATIYSGILTADDFAMEYEEPYSMLEPYGERLFFAPLQGSFILPGASITSAAGVIGNHTAVPGAVAYMGAGSITVVSTPGVYPNDPNIIYSPYNWVVTSSTSTAINQGAYFRFRFTGTSITLHFDISQMTAVVSQIDYRVDTASWTRVDLAANIPLAVPSNFLSAPSHMIEVRLVGTTAFQYPTGQVGTRWNVGTPPNVALIFTGATLDVGASTVSSQRRSRNILLYGDSIMEGYYSLWNTGPSDCSWASGEWTCYFEGCELSGAEFGIVACAGQGIVKPGIGSVPGMINTYNLIYAGQSRSFNPVPDLIVINMGANDNTDITSTMITILNSLLTYNPSTPIIVMQPLPFNQQQSTNYLINAVAGCSNPSRVTYVSTSGWYNEVDSVDGLHPDAIEHTMVLAPLVSTMIKNVLAASSVTFVISKNTTIYLEEDTYVP